MPADETERQRRNRELIELLNELRIALPGVQVLFAFLLTVPFTRGYPQLSRAARDVYFTAFILTALATALLIAPSSYHRLRFRHGDKEHMLFLANKLAIAGMLLLAIAIDCVVFVITDVIYGKTAVALATALVGLFFVAFWYVLPLAHARRGPRAR
jgi:hypothetical protein